MMYVLRSALGIAIIAFLTLSVSSSSSLYDKNDPLWELNSRNFNEVVLGKSKAWIIEFYNSWCGHCIRFAPTWKQLARDTQTWRKMIDVAAVNCNEKENVQLCRQYDVQVFPTIKFFWHHINESELGVLFDSNRDIPSMEAAMIMFLESRWNQGVPPTWSNLHPIQAKDTQSLLEVIPKGKDSIYIYAEHPDSYTGRKVILDLSFQKHHILQRLLSTSELLNELKNVRSNQSIPSLLKFDRKGNEELVMRFSKDDNDTKIRDKIFEHIIGKPRGKIEIEDIKKNETINITVTDIVHMTDLENAVYYSLSQEVGVSKHIEGEKISALKAYLSILKNYFPGSTPIMGYLSNLYNWLSYKKHSITGGEFVQAMDQLQSEDAYLPKMRDWVGCRGSTPKYRGYPCSLWTLFHTLTVQADKAFKDSQNDAVKSSENNGNVLFIIRDYVKHFFTCEECARNFLKMAQNVENEVKTSEEAMLWLWEHHNQVNKRLAGDLTEDPTHPKKQFPSPKACPKCHTQDEVSENGIWNQEEVLKYLHQFYSKESIIKSDYVRDQNMFAANENLRLSNSAMAYRPAKKMHKKKLTHFLNKRFGLSNSK